MTLDVIVLAAGVGKRMRSDLPKVLHPLAGRPLLAHVIDAARALAPRKIFVVHGHDPDKVRAAFPDSGVDWVLQADQLGTGHAVLQALPQLSSDADVLILYGDVPLVRPATLKCLVEGARGSLGVVVAELDDPSGYGRIVRDAAQRVARIVEQKDATASELAIREVNAGFFCVSARRLAPWLSKIGNDNAQNEYYLTDLVALAVADAVPVLAVKVEDPWEVAGVNSMQELAVLERVCQGREARRLLDAGVTLADPARIDLRRALECGRDVAIDVNCVFEGRVSLGDNVRVGPNCVLKNVSIGAGTEVLAFSHLDDAELGERCRVGPFARLRPGARLAEDVHVGNFVEVKASRLGAGSNANHLSYIGDAEVGSRVNVGAGTITCNYHGAAKHRTVIEDDCFIGSVPSLVAPVRTARGTYIGAGSNLSKGTPPGQPPLAAARAGSVPAR